VLGIVAGCAGERSQFGGGAPAMVVASSGTHGNSSPASAPGAYPVDSGDRLQVRVFGQPTLTGQYAIDGTGRISMPLIGNLMVRGRTTPVIEALITRRLAERYLRKPRVSVEVVVFRPFFILGQVNNAGQYPYVNGMTIETAVAIAGGYTARARKSRIRVTRNSSSGPQTSFMSPAQRVYPGDTIYVKERFF